MEIDEIVSYERLTQWATELQKIVHKNEAFLKKLNKQSSEFQDYQPVLRKVFDDLDFFFTKLEEFRKMDGFISGMLSILQTTSMTYTNTDTNHYNRRS